MSIARQYLANLGCGLRLAFFIPVRIEQIHASALMLVLLFATAVLLHFVRDFALVGPGGTLVLFGLPGVLFYVPILLGAAVAIAWIARRPDAALPLATAFAALSLPILALELIAWAFVAGSGGRVIPSSWNLWILWQWAGTGWLALGAAVATFYLLRPTGLLQGATTIVVFLVVALSLGFVYRDRTLWTKPYDEDSAQARRQYMAAATEDAIYHQPKLLERALSAIEPGRQGVIDLYYVGLGGYATQDVFLREVKSVEKLMQEQFGARGRTASLLNNPRTVMEMPIASVTSLRTVLKRVGEVMNRDEDILFLYLTSHGGKDHKFTLEFSPLTFNELTPSVLRSALDEAGIQFRVVVVSACYAGGFIKALEDERTVVIAAAAPDRKSFGCSNEAEWTYFGKAFFDEALRVQPSVTAAFAAARESIAAREKKDKVDEHSDPQMAAGKSMERQWEAYLAQRNQPGPSTPAKTADAPANGDALNELLNLWKLSEVAMAQRQECVREMTNRAPSVQVKNDPNYFGAITPGTSQWPKLVAVWERFADEYCRKTNDADMMRSAYAAAWREAADASTVEAALKYLRTGEGQKVLEAENRVSLLVTEKLTALRQGPAARAEARFQQEQAGVFAELRTPREKAGR